MEVDETLTEMVSSAELQAYFLAHFNAGNFYEARKYISGYLCIFDDAAPGHSKWYAESQSLYYSIIHELSILTAARPLRQLVRQCQAVG